MAPFMAHLSFEQNQEAQTKDFLPMYWHKMFGLCGHKTICSSVIHVYCQLEKQFRVETDFRVLV